MSWSCGTGGVRSAQRPRIDTGWPRRARRLGGEDLRAGSSVLALRGEKVILRLPRLATVVTYKIDVCCTENEQSSQNPAGDACNV